MEELWGPWREKLLPDSEKRFFENTQTGEKRAADDPPPPLDTALVHAQTWLARVAACAASARRSLADQVFLFVSALPPVSSLPFRHCHLLALFHLNLVTC